MLRQLEKEVRECIKCPLHLSRNLAVAGEGNSNAKLMFVGEAPGYHEDLEGRPFVGAAGKLLTKMIEQTLGIRRENVYITNIVKCRPPENRNPSQLEIETCAPYLERQLSIVKPQIVSSLGRYSTIYFLSKAGIVARGILSVRGKIYEFQSDSRKFSLLPTIHPAATLYDPKNLEILEHDFIKLKEMLQ
jgi:uracil-DNA glycosylase family 4